MPDPAWIAEIAALEKAATPVVCLCGSTRFGEAFFVAGWEMTLRDIIVLSIGVCKHVSPEGGHGGEALGQDVADRLDELHKRKIDLADAVIVLNIGGYVGESTASEIEYAEAHDVPVAYLESCQPPPEEWDDFAWDELAQGVRDAAQRTHARIRVPDLIRACRALAAALETARHDLAVEWTPQDDKGRSAQREAVADAAKALADYASGEFRDEDEPEQEQP